MVAYSHLSMIAFVILGLSMVRLMINYSSLLAKNHNDDPDDDVVFYWPHTAICFITFFTIILFWWTSYPLRDLTYFPNEGWNLFTFLLYLGVPFMFFMVSEVVAPQPDTYKDKSVDLREYYYKNHKVILGLAWSLQLLLIGNLFVFFHGEVESLKQKEQLEGYKRASIIKGILFDYERVLQDLTLEQLEEAKGHTLWTHLQK